MVQSGKAKNIGIFFAIFILLLGLNLGGLNFGFITMVSFAQEMGETGETVEIRETFEAQEAPVTEGTVETEKITPAEGTEEELDISLTADYITYEKIKDEDLIIAKDKVQLKYQDIEVKADNLKINLTTHLLFAFGEVYFLQDEKETRCEELTLSLIHI